MGKTIDRRGVILHDVAPGPTILIFLGIPALIIVIVIVLVFVTVRLIKRARRRILAEQVRPVSQAALGGPGAAEEPGEPRKTGETEQQNNPEQIP